MSWPSDEQLAIIGLVLVAMVSCWFTETRGAVQVIAAGLLGWLSKGKNG